MAEIGIVPNGAVLIRNGLVEQVGSARRVENLACAKRAREIDATGRVVMPAFVDADMTLVAPPTNDRSGMDECRALRLMSKRIVYARAAAMGAEWARYGCATVAASTPCAGDMKNIGKVLRTHCALQSKPLRIRSIFSPDLRAEGLTSHWLPAVFEKKLAAVLELRAGDFPSALLRTAAIAAAGLGYALRLRSERSLDPEDLQLALSAGAIAIVGPNDPLPAFNRPLASNGCVRVIPASEGFDNPERAAVDMRHAIDGGAAIALSSSYRGKATSSFNMQFLLYLAVDRLGLSPEEAITATTWNAACALRLSHVTGSLEPGKPADLLLMDVPDYRELPRRPGHHDARMVMRAGNIIYGGAALIPD